MMPRVDCPGCGVVVASVPWAEPGSRFTRDSESECTWLMSVANRKTVSGFLHVAWRTAGDIVRRVADRLRAAMPSPFDGLAAIGVDTARATRIRPWSDARTPRASSTVHGGSRNRCACSGSPLDRAGGELNRWVFRASHSRIPEIVEPAKKIRRRRPDILRTIQLGYSNARLEASDNRIKVTIRMAYGFHHANNPIALVMLRRGGLDIRPPQPRTQPTKTAEASYVLDISAQRGRCNRSITV